MGIYSASMGQKHAFRDEKYDSVAKFTLVHSPQIV